MECAGCERICASSLHSSPSPSSPIPSLLPQQGRRGSEKRLKESGVSLNMMLKCVARLVEKPLSEEQEVCGVNGLMKN